MATKINPTEQIWLKISKFIWPYIFIFLLVLFVFGNTLFPPEGKIIYGGDLLTQFYFWKGYLAESLKSGIIPFWNPYNFSGTPFLAHPSTAFFYPGTIIFLLFPLNLAFSLFYALHLFIAGVGMYVLLRTYSNKFSALGGAAAYVLGGYFASRIYAGHVDILSTSVWIGWVFWAVIKIHEDASWKNFVYLTLFFSLEILAGYMAVVFFTGELILFYVIYSWIKNKQTTRNHIAIFLGLILSLGITAIQWLPTYEFVKLSIRGSGLPYELASWGSFPMSGLKLFWNPNDLSELSKITYGFGSYILPNFFEFYTGKVVLLLIFGFIIFCIAKIILKIRNQSDKIHSDFWFLISVSLFFFWVSFGIHSRLNLHETLFNLIPFYRNIRIPAQHLIIVSFLIPLLFGMVLGKLQNNLIQGVVMLFLLIELFPYSKRYYLVADIPEAKHDRGLIEVLEKNKEETRILPNFSVVSPVLNFWDFNSTLKYKIYSTSGYDPMILRSYYEFIERLNSSSQSMVPYYNVEIPPVNIKSPALNQLNIGYVLIEPGVPSLDERKYQLVKKNEKYALYKKIETKDQLSFYSSNPSSDCKDVTKAKISVLKRLVNETVISADTNCNGILVLSEVNYPGWKAVIDGQETPLFNENHIFRAINLPKGTHIIRFFYSPDIYYRSGLISLFSFILLIVLIKFIRI